LLARREGLTTVRKWIGWLLMLLGAFLLTVAVLALVWAPGSVKRTPLDTDTRTYLSGQADKLNPASGEVEEALPVAVLSHTQVDQDRSDDDVIVFQNTVCANIDVEDPADCLTDEDERLITNDIDVFATDRTTAESVNDSEYLPASAEPHEGLVNKFPFDTEQQTYEFWDGLLGRAVPAEFVGEEFIDGLRTYEFNISIEDEPATVVGDVAGTYSMDKTVWIEPTTGAIIDQEQDELRTLEDGSTVLDMQLSFTDETVAANVDDGKSNSRLIGALGSAVPLISGILGVIALGVGLLLVLRSRSGSHSRSEA
jgi:hypothetical protein